MTDRNTRVLRKRIGLVFDFDGTLAPDSYSSLIAHFGLDPDQFDRERVQPLLDDGWEEIPAKFYALIQESKQRTDPEEKITRERIAAFARDLEPFEGVEGIFDTIRHHVRELNPEVEVEFYLVSSGIADISRGTRIAGQFKAVWGCEFHYDEAGEIDFVKRILSYVDKTRFLRQISLGINDQERTSPPTEVFRTVAPEDLYLPLDQVIYAGDGASDVPAFGLLAQENGVALGIAKEESDWQLASSVGAQERVSNLVPPHYRPGDELPRSLLLAVEMILKRIDLRTLGAGE